MCCAFMYNFKSRKCCSITHARIDATHLGKLCSARQPEQKHLYAMVIVAKEVGATNLVYAARACNTTIRRMRHISFSMIALA